MATLFDKKLADLQAAGCHLQQGVNSNGKIYLFVDSAFSGLEGNMCAYAPDGRSFRKDDSLVIWSKDGVISAAVLGPKDRNNSKYTDVVLA